jgi:hypothetical protein
VPQRQRRKGCRVRFRLKANAVKFYDHANVFRVETTIRASSRCSARRKTRRTGRRGGVQ